jgi:VanZ family protein
MVRLIFTQSSRLSPESLPDLAHLDKLLHFAGYGLLSVLFLRAYQTLPLKNYPGLMVTLSILSSFLYGISDELHQYYVPGRNSDLMDVLADLLGSVFGVLLYQLIRAHRYNQATEVSE